MTDEYISKIEEITGKDQRNRMLEIVRIMRRHDFVRNFMKQQNPEEVRLALEELGPTFIKGGQILSTRPDLISPAFISEFKKLQDNVQIDSFESVSKTFREQTEKNISDVFDKFDEKPFASASIGQTHHAVLKNGTQVVVKVQHPKIGHSFFYAIALSFWHCPENELPDICSLSFHQPDALCQPADGRH